MTQNVFAISGFINFAVSVLICVFVLWKKRSISNLIFALLAFATVWWSFGYWRWLSEYQSINNAIFWLKFLTFGSSWIPIFFLHWISLLLKSLIDRKINDFV